MKRAATFLIVLALLVPLMSARPVAADGTALAGFNGFAYDRVGGGNTQTPDGSPDGTFTLTLERGGSHRVT